MATNMKKKAARVEEKREKRPYAVAKYVRVSPYKVRTVLDLIRGKSVREAQAILENSVNGGAAPTKKVLMSAGRERGAQPGHGQRRSLRRGVLCERRYDAQENAARFQGQRARDPQENESHHGHSGRQESGGRNLTWVRKSILTVLE